MPRPRTWSDGDLREAVASSTTLAEVVRKLRLRRGGAAYTTVRTRIEVLGLDVQHFRQNAASKIANGHQRPAARRWTDADLRDAVEQSTSLSEVFRHLGLEPGGSQWIVMRQLIIDRGFSTSHWLRPLATSKADPTRSARFRTAVDAADLAALVKTARSRADVIRQLGFEPTPALSRILRQRLDELDIRTDHFESPEAGMRRASRPRWRIRLEDILVANSTYRSTSTLKRRLIEASLLAARCAICGIDEWVGKPIVLHLDHISGNRTDNRLENLRLLCPNCHSQTDTYCGRNIGRRSDVPEAPSQPPLRVTVPGRLPPEAAAQRKTPR